MGGWCKAGPVGLHEVNGTFVVISNDVDCFNVEGEFGVLLVALSQLRYLSLDHRCDWIFYELVPLGDPSYLEVEEFLAASQISRRDEHMSGVVWDTSVVFRGSRMSCTCDYAPNGR